MNSPVFCIALIVISCYFAVTSAAGPSGWNYIRDDANKGPDNWAANYSECAGDSNSPINIVKADATVMTAEEWELSGWDMTHTWNVTDQPYTVGFSLQQAGALTTNGGGLGTAYDVVQFHLHWGATDAAGGEHTIDGEAYPMEVHFVHKRSDFNSLTAAVQSEDEDALAVLGIFFEIQDDDNSDLDSLIDAITAARADANGVSSKEIDFTTVLDTDAFECNFYRYSGGLTTPGCNQVVKWTVFESKIPISAAQMEMIRNKTENTYGTELYRPVQPLNNRTVTLYTCSNATMTSTTTTTEAAAEDTTVGKAPAVLAPASALIAFLVVVKYI